MAVFIAEHFLEIIFSVISLVVVGYCKHLHNQNKELKRMQDEDKNRKHREMLLDEIEPLVNELGRLKREMTDLEIRMNNKVTEAQTEAEITHKTMYDDLNKIQKENEKNFELIINSYKYRLIQLCKSHLKDNFITEEEFEQISEMYKLYHGMGGNGQAQDYYEKVLQLEIR